MLDLPGIIDPNTGKILTVGEAIKLHLLDVRTGEVLLAGGEKMSLEKAAEQRLINPELAMRLMNHLGAAQQELTEAEGGNDSRIKVTTSTATISSQIKTIADAIKDGTVDPILGVYKLPDGSTITITDAYQRGLLIRNETVKIKSTPLCLADAISHGLVDQAGWVVDRNAGDKFRLDSAIANALILPHFQEVVDTRNDVKVTVTKAIEMGLLNAKTGRYVNPLSKEKLTFIEAKNRQLIVRPMTLKDVCDSNLMDREGLIISPTRKGQLKILAAIQVGILDGDEIHSISKGDEGELLTLNDAIGQGIVGVDNNFKNMTSGETMTIQDAVNEGLISSVMQKSLFDIDGFKDPHSGEFVSLNDAISKDILVKTQDGIKLDSGKNKLVSVEKGIELNLVRPEVFEMMNRRVGVFDEEDHEISVLDLVLYDLIDSKSGYLLDYDKQTVVPLNQAIERKMITAEGALLLSSLLNITLTTETVTNTEKRFITIANTRIGGYPETPDRKDSGSLELFEAIDSKIFDPSTGIFTIPNTDRLVSFEECIQLGLINPESMRIVDPKYKEEISVHRALERNILDTTGHYRSPDGWVPMNQGIERGLIILNPSQENTRTLEFTISPRRTPVKTPEIEYVSTSPEPVEITPGVIYDPSTALVINMKTGKSENLLQAVKNNLVDSETVQVIDHTTGLPISIGEAIKKGLVSPQTGEVIGPSGQKINLMDAVKTGLLVVVGVPLVAAAGAINSLKMVFDPSTNQHIPAELAYERGLVSRDEISDFTYSDSIPRSAVISQASSFDIPTPKDMMALTPSKSRRHSGLCEDEESLASDVRPTTVPRKSLTDTALENEFSRQISSGHDSVDDVTKKPSEVLTTHVTINEALQRGLLDLKNGTYTDPLTNKQIPIQEAVNKGHLVSTSDNIEEEILNISPIHDKSTTSNGSHEIEKVGGEKTDKDDSENVEIDEIKRENLPYQNKEFKGNANDPKNIIDLQKVTEIKVLAVEKIKELEKSEKLVPTRRSLEKDFEETENDSKNLTPELQNTSEKKLECGNENSEMKTQKSQSENLEETLESGIISKKDLASELSQESNKKNSSTDPSKTVDNSKLEVNNKPKESQTKTDFDDSDLKNIAKIATDPNQNLDSLNKDSLKLDSPVLDKPVGDESKSLQSKQDEIDKTALISSSPLESSEALNEPKVSELNKPLSAAGTQSKVPQSQIESDETFAGIEKINDNELKSARSSNPNEFSVDSVSKQASVTSLKQSQTQPQESQIGANIANAAKLGLMAIVGAPVLAGMAVADSVKNLMSKSDDPRDHQANSQQMITKPPYGQDKMVFSTIKEMSESVISDVFQPDSEMKVDEKVTAEDLEKLGAFDKRTGTFIDPSTGNKVPFDDFIYNCGVFNPELIYVKDFSNDNYVPLAVALEKVLIDRNTGIMVEPKSGKRVPFFECLKRLWIIQKEPPKAQAVSLQEARESGYMDEDSGKMSVDGILLPINEALNSGVLEIDSISIRNSEGEIIPLSHAIETGIVDLKRGVIIDPKTGEIKPLDSAFKDGNLLEGIKCPISLEAVVNSNLYDKDTRKIKDSNELLTVQEAINDGIIDPNISLIKNMKTKEILPLQKAIDGKLIEDGLVTNTETGERVSLDEAVKQNLITTKPVKMTLIDAIVKEFYKIESQKILNPMSGNFITVDEAIHLGLIDIDTTLIVNEKNDNVVSAEDAINSGLLNTQAGRLTNPDLNLSNAHQRGYILSSKKPISLADAILRNIYDATTGKLKPNKNEMTLDECIATGEVSSNDLIVHDPKSNEIISVNDAIKSGLIDAKRGCVNEPFNGEELSFNEAVDRGIIILSKKKCSLPEAVFKGLYDPQSGTFANTTTTEKLSTERAIKRGFIDPQSTIVNIGGKIFPFELSVESGMVDTKRGTITDEYGNKIDFREAFDRGILVEVRKPIGLYEALVKGIYDEESGLFMDPQSGKRLTLEQAISNKLIDPNSVQIKDASAGYKDISLVDAIQTGVIDDKSNVKVDTRNLTLKQAFDLGILCDKKAPISIQRAIHQGIYDFQSGKLLDTTTEKKMTLHEAMRRWIINPQLPCYFNESEENLLSLADCCRLKMIDRREGVFKEPGSNVFVPLNEAMGLGLIVDIESGGFGLYEMLAMKLYDIDTGRFINPANGRMVTMANAIEDDLLSLVSSLVKHPSNGAYLKLSDAIKVSVIDVVEGKFVFSDGKKIDLQEARRLGYIVSQQKLLSLESAVKMGLYQSEIGKFVDPSTNKAMNVQECIDVGLIDGDTTVLKNSNGQDKPIKQAIEAGDIDVEKGRVGDPPSTFDVAFIKGLLATVQKPITEKSFNRNECFENILKPELSAKEITLQEAVKQGLINGETYLVKDPKTGQFQSLSKALEDGIVDPLKKISIDPSALFLTVDSTSVVYSREPESFENAVESGHLNLSNGSYNNRDTATACSLKEAITSGVIDPESALIKDGAKGKMIRLPEAFRKGLIDSDKFNVVDTSNSKLLSLQHAVDDAILVTPKRSLDLLEALKFNLYDPDTGSFNDPFTTANLPITLQEAIAKGLIDPSTTIVRDLNNSEIATLPAAISSGLVDPIKGRLTHDKEPLDFAKARDKGLLLPAEQRVSNSVRRRTKHHSPSCVPFLFGSHVKTLTRFYLKLLFSFSSFHFRIKHTNLKALFFSVIKQQKLLAFKQNVFSFFCVACFATENEVDVNRCSKFNFEESQINYCYKDKTSGTHFFKISFILISNTILRISKK